MKKFLLSLIVGKNGKASLSRLGYALTVATAIFWVNVIFFLYVYCAYKGSPIPDMPSQLVMVILTLLGGYLGSKGTEAFARFSQGNEFTNTINSKPPKEEAESQYEDGPPPAKGNLPGANSDL